MRVRSGLLFAAAALAQAASEASASVPEDQFQALQQRSQAAENDFLREGGRQAARHEHAAGVDGETALQDDEPDTDLAAARVQAVGGVRQRVRGGRRLRPGACAQQQQQQRDVHRPCR